MLTLAIAQFRPDKGAYARNLARLGEVFKEVGQWPDPPGLVVVQHWDEELKRLVPTK